MQILGIDIGTTKIAGILVKLPENITEKVISIEHGAAIPSPNNWEQIQDPDIIVDKVKLIISRLKETSVKKIDAIGVSSQMHGCVYVGADSKALSPLYTWLDGRASIPLNGDDENVLERILKKTGKPIYSGYGIATHYYNYRKKIVPDHDYKMVTIGGYVVMQLCGIFEACIDPSEGASFGFYDTIAGCFDREDLEILFGSTDFLPREVPFYYTSGRDESGVPVFQSIGDNQASFMGAMLGHEEDILLNIGTSGQISFLTDEIPSKLNGIEIRPYPGKNLVVGATLTGGKSYALLIDFFHDVLSAFNFEMDKVEMMEILNNLEIAEPENPLSVVSAFNGTRINPDLRGAINNIDLKNFNVETIVYAFVEAMVMELKILFDDNELSAYVRGNGIVGSGNAVRRNPLLRKLISKKFDRSLHLSGNIEEAACGAAYYVFQGMRLAGSKDE